VRAARRRARPTRARAARATFRCAASWWDLDTGRPLPNRTVSVHDESAATDAAGTFALHARTIPFDVVVTEPDGAAISVYRGVTSGALTLVHSPSGEAPAPTKSADVQGNLVGVGAYPLAEREGVSVHFLSGEAVGSLVVPATLGPDFGPMRVEWDGPDTLEGKVVAIRFAADEEGVSRFDGLAIAEVTLTAGEVVNVDLALEAASEGRLTGSIEVPEAHGVGFVQRSYRVPSSRGRIPFSLEETMATTFDLTVPDLAVLGGSYCVSAGSSSPFFKTERCGLPLDAAAGTLILQEPS
jgi:hypothetical protein